MAGRRPEAVVFDALGTLVRLEPPPPPLRAALSERGIPVSLGDAERAFRAEIDYYLAHHLEGSDARALDRLRDACAEVIVRALDLPDDSRPRVREAMLAAISFSPWDDAAPVLRTLREAGLGVAVASNWDCSLPDVLERCGLASLVDVVMTSAEAGAAKPDPAVVRAALQALDASPSRVVFVGDSAHDVAAARRAAVEPLLLVRAGASEVPDASGAPVIRSLDEAVSLILPAR